jgi:Tfp pilus assembly protein PilF
LFAVDDSSPYYNERNKMSIFYAESWALTHMLELGAKYRDNLRNFLNAVASGRSTSDCFQSFYGKNLAEVTKDLQAYLHQSSVQAALFDVKLPKADLEPQVEEASDFGVELTLAQIQAAHKHTVAEGAARLHALATKYPTNAEVQESLAFAAWEQHDAAEAQQQLKHAIDAGSTNPEVFLTYAELLHNASAASADIVPILQRAVELRPASPDIWFNLGSTATAAGQYALALDAFSHLKQTDQERAYDLFFAEGYCYLRLHAPAAARAVIEKARKYAQTTDQQRQIAAISNELEALTNPPAAGAVFATAKVGEQQPQPPATNPNGPAKPVSPVPTRDVPSIPYAGDVQHVEAIAKFFECTKKARFHVWVGAKELTLEIENPQAVVVRNGGSSVRDLECGAQIPFKVGIVYVRTAAQTGVDGFIRELVF